MATQESTLGGEGLNVYFVIPSKYDSDKECSDDMWLAYNKCEEFDINPIWITEKECQNMEPQKVDVFIMEEFSGKLFETLRSSKCSIVGPRCLLCCLMNNEPIPEGSNPVFVTAMRDVVVCASGFPVEKKLWIQEKVEFMGGIYSRQLVGSVMYLVTDRIMSQKYETAVKKESIKIMTIDWISAIWKENMTKFIKATDSKFDRYKCPVFLNTFITSTDLQKHQKKEIMTLVNANGGEYTGDLDGSQTNILITSERGTMTKKLQFALQKDIACLRYPWITDSIKAGHALAFEDYLVTSSNACSTPERTNATLDFTCGSIIPFDNQIVDESLAQSTMNKINSTCTPSSTLPNQTLTNKESYMIFLDGITLVSVKKLGPFLDGCNIFLTGFQSKYKDKLNKIINVSSATRLDDITDNITHVLVGDVIKAKNDLKTIYSDGLRPYIVNFKWLEESIKLKQPASEECFLIETENTLQKVAEPPSPLSKKNMEMLKRPQKPPPPLFNDNTLKEAEVFDEPDLIAEYSRRPTAPTKSTAEIFQISSKNSNEKLTKSINTTSQSTSFRYKTRDSESSVPLSQTDTIVGKVFEGQNFILSGFQREEYHHLEMRIRAMGGEIVSRSYPGIPDFGVVPFCGGIFRGSVNEIVTDMFIDDCVDRDELVPLLYYHRPIVIKEDVKPLQDCVIAISTYSGQERQFLQQLAESLGALHQDTFARRTNLVKKTLANTHLICPLPEGSKYSAAVKWNLPAVSAEWLMECANKSSFINETPYLVGITKIPESQNIGMKPPTQTPSKAFTPIRLAAIQQQETPGMQTPLVNKRLSGIMNKTPQSPFHVNTPETPYGAFIKDNPSPDTRKGWVKWINNFPDLRETDNPPPTKRRAPSTPFSDLKRQLWEKLKGPLDGESSGNTSLNNSNSTENDKVFQAEDRTNRKLSYADENSPAKANLVDLQIQKFDKALRASTSSSGSDKKRFSMSVDSEKKYQFEPETDKCMEKETQPFTVGWQYPIAHEETTEPANEELTGSTVPMAATTARTPTPEVPKRKFMLSGLKDKPPYEKVIIELGGEVSTELTFDSTATHLLSFKPARNEKVLGSIASGKWILHPNYIKDSEIANKFLDEEAYEWGNPNCSDILLSSLTTEIEFAIAAAAYRWRIKLTNEPGGAFEDMVALLLVQEEKLESFERLIVAGNGCVVKSSSSNDQTSSEKKITHCFIQLKQKDQIVDWATMASKGILCFHPQYLHNILTSESSLNPRENVLPEFKKYLALFSK
ncbi:DNA topoisomerase 2-binding protein 1 isoform X2 [Leptopilina boulardi]|uniref:DNA topoisomerase 2-binding protein 1 isoform X2 n=1 Tax=Leptopilina boulardi TaxID=63433 RepID=UPI0021F52FFB|nr:DNA topoisomerase 2-binding protein 1 isoform X2 [Leptopilina boulardi]